MELEEEVCRTREALSRKAGDSVSEAIVEVGSLWWTDDYCKIQGFL